MLDIRPGEPRAERAVVRALFVTEGKVEPAGLVLGGVEQAAIDRRDEPGSWIADDTTGEGWVVHDRLNERRQDVIGLRDAVILQIRPEPVQDALMGFPDRAEIPCTGCLRLQIRVACADYRDVVGLTVLRIHDGYVRLGAGIGE